MSSRAWTPPTIRWNPGKTIRKRFGADSGRESFPCQHVCGECGWLAERSHGACPSCAHEAWIDLGPISTAEALRTHERTHTNLNRKQTLVLEGSLATILAGWLSAGVAISMMTLPVIGIMTTLITGVTLARSLRQPIAAALHRSQSQAQLPARHRRALPPAAGLTGTLRGRALAPPLRSPIGDQPCLAWRVRARLHEDAGTDERLMIDDTRSAEFELATHRFEADSVEIEAPVERSKLSELEPAAHARAVRFLRERGCFSHEGSWVFEEEFIPLDRPLALEGRGGQLAPSLRCDDGAPPSPYR